MGPLALPPPRLSASLPPVHCGDIVGNYGRNADLLQHLSDFLAWLAEVAPRYQSVVRSPGLSMNHSAPLLSPPPLFLPL